MSEITAAPYIALGMLGPASLWIFWASKRARRKLAEQDVAVPKEFAPADQAAPGMLLRRFDPVQQILLRGQMRGARVGFCVLSWVLFVLFTSSLLPSSVAATHLAGDWPGSRTVAVWYSFLNTVSLVGSTFLGAVGLISGLFATSGLALSAAARRTKTKPVSRQSLYWTRIVPALLTLLAAYAAALGVSLLVMLACYGTGFLHLGEAQRIASASVVQVSPSPGLNHGVALSLDHQADLREVIRRSVRLAQTSPFQLFLSIALKFLVGFSLAVAAALQPLQFLRTKAFATGVLWGLILLMQVGVFSPVFLPLRISKVLFLYGSLGPPPPWGYAAIPILVIALLLYLGSVFNERLES